MSDAMEGFEIFKDGSVLCHDCGWSASRFQQTHDCISYLKSKINQLENTLALNAGNECSLNNEIEARDAEIKELEAQLNLDGTTNSQRCGRCHLANFFNGKEFKCWYCGLEHT